MDLFPLFPLKRISSEGVFITDKSDSQELYK